MVIGLTLLRLGVGMRDPVTTNSCTFVLPVPGAGVPDEPVSLVWA